MNYQTLYKKTQTGAIQQWSVEVNGNVVKACFGQKGGKLQVSEETIREGKNIGRANETTPAQQAEAEALATWTKKLKSGYVTTFDAAQDGETDALIEGGVLPMLAPSKSYPTDSNFAKKITFPAFVQPKLDGARCIAVVENGKCTLWSRTRKQIHSVPHIVKQIEAKFDGSIILDGELYNHEFADSFELLMSKIRQSKPMPGHEDVQYHIYDIVDLTLPYFSRAAWFDVFMWNDPYLKQVQTEPVYSQAEALEWQEKFELQGYEGAMIRNANGLYESGKRSTNLQKMKSFIEGEFKIVGANEGKARDEGTVGAFVCVTEEGKEFRCRLKATWERRQELFRNPAQWEGKMLTVTYKRMTSDNVPYIPIGKGIRDYE